MKVIRVIQVKSQKSKVKSQKSKVKSQKSKVSGGDAKIKTKFRIENITPILNVKDISASVNFFVEILGFTNAEWGDENFTCVSRDGSSIYLCKNGQGNPGTWIWVGFDGNIFELYSEFKARGVLIQPPVSHPWAMEMLVQDPDGHILRFGTDPENNTNT